MARRPATWVTLLVTLTLAISACGGGDSDPTPTPVPPEEIMNQASQRFDEVNSFHFLLRIDGELSLDQSGSLRLRGAEGDLLRPDSAQTEASIAFGGANISIELISVGGEMFMTNLLTGNWERAPGDLGFDPAVLFDNERGISSIMRRIENPQVVGSEEIRGTDAYHMRGTVTAETVQPITGGSLEGDDIELEIWISHETNDILQIELGGASTSGGADSATWTLEVSDHNEPVTIERPDV